MRMAPLVTPFAASASFGKLAGRAVVLLPVNGTAVSQLTGLDAVRARRFSRLYDVLGDLSRRFNEIIAVTAHRSRRFASAIYRRIRRSGARGADQQERGGATPARLLARHAVGAGAAVARSRYTRHAQGHQIVIMPQSCGAIRPSYHHTFITIHSSLSAPSPSTAHLLLAARRRRQSRLGDLRRGRRSIPPHVAPARAIRIESSPRDLGPSRASVKCADPR